MALQYWHSLGTPRSKFVALRSGYHGDTFGAMSVTDPEGSMHSLYKGFLAEHHFVPAPETRFDAPWDAGDMAALEQLLAAKHVITSYSIHYTKLYDGVACWDYLRCQALRRTVRAVRQCASRWAGDSRNNFV